MSLNSIPKTVVNHAVELAIKRNSPLKKIIKYCYTCGFIDGHKKES